MAIAFYIPALDDEAENARLLQQQQMVLQQQLLLQQQYHLQAQLLQLQQSIAGQPQPQSATASTSSPSPSPSPSPSSSGTPAGAPVSSAAAAPSTSTPTNAPSTSTGSLAAQPPTTISNTLHHNHTQLMRVALYDILFRHAMDTTPARSRCKLCSKLCYLLRKVC